MSTILLFFSGQFIRPKIHLGCPRSLDSTRVLLVFYLAQVTNVEKKTCWVSFGNNSSDIE